MTSVAEIRTAIAEINDLRSINGDIDSAVLAALLKINSEAVGSGTPTEPTVISSIPLSNLTNIPSSISATTIDLYGFYVDNPNNVDVYLKFYNTASPTVGTTATVRKFRIPLNGFLYIQPGSVPIHSFSTALSVAVTTGLADNNSTAPTTALYGVFDYV